MIFSKGLRNDGWFPSRMGTAPAQSRLGPAPGSLVISVFIAAFLILLPSVTTAQPSVNTQSFFGLQPQTATDGPTGPADAKMPWFESYEFRTQTRDFDLDRQEYTFRLSPSTRAKVRAQESLYRHLGNSPDFEADDDRCRSLADRYEDWIELYFLRRQTELLEDLFRVREDEATVLRRLAGTLEVNWSEHVSNREDRTDLRVELLNTADRERYLRDRYGLGQQALDFTDLLPPAEMRRRLEAALFAATDPEMDHKLETVRRELELEQAEQKQYLDFAQVRYRGPHDNPARERVAVGVALKLPNSGNQKLKLRELELEAESLRRKQGREAAAGAADYAARRSELLGMFDRYGTFSEIYRAEAADFADLSRAIAAKQGVSPLPLLKMKARSLRNDLKLLRLRAALYQDYLDLMERSGALCTATGGEVLR